MRVLVTGGAGFIGSHLVEHFYKNTDWEIIILDRLNYAGSLDRLVQFRSDARVTFRFHDIRGQISQQLLRRLEGVHVIVHAAAETHVENSLHEPLVFVESNVGGTFQMLEAARALQVDKFVMVSTDEVFGPAPMGVDYKEDDRLDPSNPYSATKAGAEALVLAWAKCFKLPVLLTRTMNNFGERQHPEKFVPMVMRKVLNSEQVNIHFQYQGNTKVIGSRKWLHARNHSDGILHLLKTKQSGKFHIAGEELTNLQMADRVASIIGKPMNYELVDWHSSRPGHDLRYSMDDSKIRATGWKPPLKLQDSLEKTVKWTLEHKEWLDG